MPSRVVVYLLLAAALFAELGYGQVWARMTAGLDGISVADRCPQRLPRPVATHGGHCFHIFYGRVKNRGRGWILVCCGGSEEPGPPLFLTARIPINSYGCGHGGV